MSSINSSFVGFLLLLAVFSARAEPVDNVLFLIADDLKASVLGCYGDRICETPNIDSLASDGMVFEHAYCQGTSCAPSRTSLMHSRYQGGADLNLGLHFRNHDIFSARVGKIYHMRVPGDIVGGTHGSDIPSSWDARYNAPGLEAHTPGDYACLNLDIFTTELEGRESTKDKHRMFVEVRYEGDGSDQPDHKAASKAIEILEEQKQKGTRFLLATGFVRPHYPMVAPEQFFEPYDIEKMPLPEVPEGDLEDMPKLAIAGTKNATNPIGQYPQNQKRMWAAYYASTAFMDAQVGRVLDALDHLGLRESTAVVFTSDHGYHLGEHTFWQKSNLHEEVLRVPLIIDAPGRPAGRSTSMVELVDLFPTLADLAGLDAPSGVDGKSLTPILDDPAATVKDSALSFNNGHSLRVDGWHYMRYRDGSEELYDMEADPGQFTNLAAAGKEGEQLRDLRAQLDTRLAGAGLAAKRKQ